MRILFIVDFRIHCGCPLTILTDVTYLSPTMSLTCSEISLPLLVQVSSTKTLEILTDKNMIVRNHKGKMGALK